MGRPGANLLSQEQEEELLRRSREGDLEARNQVVVANLGFANMIAYRCCRRNSRLPLEDARQEARVGLIEAAGAFVPGKGARFVSYARYHIMKRIHIAREKTYIISLPAYLWGDLARAKRKIERQGRTIDADVDLMSGQARRSILSLSEKMIRFKRGGELIAVIDDLADFRARRSQEKTRVELDVNRLLDAIRELPTLECYVIQSLFGIVRPLRTLVDLSAEMGLSRYAVARLKNSALRRLRASMDSSCANEIESSLCDNEVYGEKMGFNRAAQVAMA